jgi:cobalt transporter subunit CbtB
MYNPLSGVTGLGDRIMTTETKEIAVSTPATTGIALAFITGLTLLFASGYAQATALHDAAHDQRHAMAFPCH